ncbi:MAG: aminotransferase class V-fold PLP-dependent enzyme [Clostridiaceae bacterium]|nr:aminotransferase class V-fold PLP-dependent enzyme [Clostridiaceae bacterium]
MKETPFLHQLLKLKEENITSFHVPGHKNGKIFESLLYKNFKENLVHIDTTEIMGTDNLHQPMEVIKQAQERAKETFKSKETFFLVNGSTAGVYSMIMAVTNPGDKIIIGRNCHKSVFNATILGNLTPVYLNPSMDVERGLALGISPKEVEKTLMQHPDVRAVILTYPTYHGFTSDLKKIAEIVHSHGKILLVDEAHGAHLDLSEDLPMPALACGADAVVQSTHKTLPAFTQSSMLHVQGDRINLDKLRFMLQLHQSSSPSYILMASLDLAVTIYNEKGKELMKQLLENIRDFKQQLSKQKGIEVLDRNLVGKNYIKDMDPTKLWISMAAIGISGYELEKRLRTEFQIQVELSNLYGTLAITSIANKKQDFNKLYDALSSIAEEGKEEKIEELPSFAYTVPKQVYTPREALYKNKRSVTLEEGIGHISGEYLIPYPPGIPIVLPGERITEEMITYVQAMVKKGMEVVGLKDINCRTIEIID